jgi:hypothetical protein
MSERERHIAKRTAHQAILANVEQLQRRQRAEIWQPPAARHVVDQQLREMRQPNEVWKTAGEWIAADAQRVEFRRFDAE